MYVCVEDQRRKIGQVEQLYYRTVVYANDGFDSYTRVLFTGKWTPSHLQARVDGDNFIKTTKNK